MEQQLENQVAIVTGGNAGIGKAIARKFIEEGAKLALFGKNVEKGAAVVNEIRQLTQRPEDVLFYCVDVSQHIAVQHAIDQVLEKFGRVDILVNNAGVTIDRLLMRMNEEEWDQVLDINLKSCYNTCHALVRPMIRAKKGKIINISSVVGLKGNVGQANYAASKAGMIGFTKALAKELAPRDIQVNCIAPGFIDTNMIDILSDSQRESILKEIPLGRMGKPLDVANLACFLASSLSNYITGQTIAIDGGMV